jgi:hypothetical protein
MTFLCCSTDSQQVQQQQQQMRNGIPQLNSSENGMNGNKSVGGGSNQQKMMRDNLHFAADSVSNAMTSLVRELNTGGDYLK